jgi:hypothetical protein
VAACADRPRGVDRAITARIAARRVRFIVRVRMMGTPD